MNELSVAIISGIIAMIGWGVADIFAKKALDVLGHYRTLIYTNLLLIMFTLPLFFYDRSLPDFSLNTFLFIVIFGVADFLGYILLYKAYSIGNVSIINPITSTYVVLSAIFSYFVFGEAFPPIKIIAFIIVMIGVALTAFKFSDLKSKTRGGESLAKGLPYAMLVFLIYGAYIPLWDRFIEGDGWVFLSFMTRTATLVVVTLYTVLIKKQSPAIFPTKSIIWWLVLNGLLLGLGNNAFNWGLNASSQTSVTAAIAAAYPLSLVIGAYFLLKERLELSQYIGIILIVTGIVAMTFI